MMWQPRTIRSTAVAAAVAATVGVLPLAAEAANQKLLGTFKDWNAFTFNENGQKVCFISSQPKKKEPANAKRSPIFVLVTHRPGEKRFDEVSFIAGYPLRKTTDPEIEIGDKTFKLFVDGETGWARDSTTDKQIVDAMRGGSSMIVKGVSARGTKTTDTFSLSGVSDAHEAINEACGVKR